MTARRSSSDPVSHHLAAGERIVWRHQPTPRALFYNRLPSLVLVLIMTAFIAWVSFNIVSNTLPNAMPTEFTPWLIAPAFFIAFVLVLIYFYARFVWRHLGSLVDSWSTHYALTDRRFMIVSKRGVIDYGASYFRKMEPLGGAPGAQALAFDWGRLPKGRENYRDRIAGLPDAAKLERLIRETLRA
jgi:membrane protein implicated in regulation of membrane protease activity